MRKSVNGFTIVELLIVIVVIGILAAITLISFIGIQGRGFDATVQSDLEGIGKKLESFVVDTGSYPSNTNASLLPVGIKISTNAYATSPTVARNLAYCINASLNEYAVVAKSKSGNAYYIGNKTGAVKPYTETWGSTTTGANICSSTTIGLSSTTQTPGYWDTNNGWQAWSGGVN